MEEIYNFEMGENDYRHERKFLVKGMEKENLKQIVSNIPGIFSEIFHERRINNLYLDFFDLNNYFRHVGGEHKRYKIRIRWYGGLFGFVKNPILELKIKCGHLSRKERFPLKSFNFRTSFNYNLFNRNILQKSNLPQKILELLNMVGPSLLNSYLRRYFLSSNKKVRLTIDRDLFFSKLSSGKNFVISSPSLRNEFIVELKYHNLDEPYVSEVIQSLPFRIVANSKYIFGIETSDLF